MAQLKGKDLIVANTSNVKEMKNGRPMNVKLVEGTVEANLVNGIIVTLGEVEPGASEEMDHVFPATALAASAVAAAVQAGKAYVIVAPEIMVEQAAKVDGHIGLFRLSKDEVYTAYQLSVHDRMEYCAEHPMAGAGKVITTRTMATGIVAKPGENVIAIAGVYDNSIVMKKVEFLPATE